LRKPILTVSPDVSTQDAPPEAVAAPSAAAVRAPPHADSVRAAARAAADRASARFRVVRRGRWCVVNGVPFADDELAGGAGPGTDRPRATALCPAAYTGRCPCRRTLGTACFADLPSRVNIPFRVYTTADTGPSTALGCGP